MHHKSLAIEHVSFKFDDAARKFSGYASVFGGVDSYGDTIMPGAYKNTLTGRVSPVALRWNHYGPVIGKWISLGEDEKGLFVEGELTPGHSVAEDAYASLKHGAVTGLSIGYQPVKEEKNDHGGVDLYEIKLREISVVESPADLAAQISDVKSAINEARTLKEIETLLRDARGFSRAEATALVARIKSIAHGDREEQAQHQDVLTAIRAIKKLL